MRREYPEAPLAGVGAVVWDGDKVLLIQRAQEPGKGTWGLPGGLVELGETVTQALRREVAEETGLDVEVGAIVGVFELITRNEQGRVRFHYIVLDFLAQVQGGVLRPDTDVSDTRWVDLDDLAAYRLRPETADMIQRARVMKSTG